MMDADILLYIIIPLLAFCALLVIFRLVLIKRQKWSNIKFILNYKKIFFAILITAIFCFIGVWHSGKNLKIYKPEIKSNKGINDTTTINKKF